MGIFLPLLVCGGVIGYMVFMTRFFLLAARAHSDLVRFEYEHLPAQWEKDGEPQGFLFWRSPTPASKIINRYFLSNPGWTIWSWSLRRPDWVKSYPEAQAHLKALRWNLLWWNLGILVPFLVLTLAGSLESNLY